MRHRSFSIRLARFFLLAVFTAHAFLASAGAHYEIGLSHLTDGAIGHKHQSGLHFSAFDNDCINKAVSVAQLKDGLANGNENSACFSPHIHISNICIGEKLIDHTPSAMATKTEVNNSKLQRVALNTVLYDYLPHTLRLLPSRSPPLL